MWQIIINGMNTRVKADSVEITDRNSSLFTDIRITVGKEHREFTVYENHEKVKIIPPAPQTLEPVFPGTPDHPALDYRLPV